MGIEGKVQAICVFSAQRPPPSLSRAVLSSPLNASPGPFPLLLLFLRGQFSCLVISMWTCWRSIQPFRGILSVLWRIYSVTHACPSPFVTCLTRPGTPFPHRLTVTRERTVPVTPLTVPWLYEEFPKGLSPRIYQSVSQNIASQVIKCSNSKLPQVKDIKIQSTNTLSISFPGSKSINCQCQPHIP